MDYVTLGLLAFNTLIVLAVYGAVQKRRKHRSRAVCLRGRISQEVQRDSQFRQEENMPQFDLHDGFAVRYTPQATDAEGNLIPGAVQPGTLSIVNAGDTALVSVTLDGDTARIASVPGPGTGPTDVTFSADVDAGEGTTTREETFTVNIIAGTPDALTGSIGAEEPR